MPSHDILGNDALVAPAALARAIVPLLVSYTGRDRRFVQEMQDQSIKRGSSAKELGDRRDAANCLNGIVRSSSGPGQFMLWEIER